MSLSVTASQAYCQQVARRTGKNFYHTFRVLPREERTDMATLYAFMRKTDDLADSSDPPDAKRVSLGMWRSQLATALGGQGLDADPMFPALAEMVARRDIPAEYLNTVIDGCTSDIDGVEIETFQQLRDYCYRVAGVVGLCCIRIWGYDGSEAAEHKAIDTGTALQLTNILRDLPEDTRSGRFYLPSEDLKRFGVTRPQLVDGLQTGEYLELMAFECQRAGGLYGRAEELMTHLERPGRKALAAMLKLYGSLLDEIERNDYDVYSSRIRVPWWRKAAAVLRAVVKR